MKRITVPLGPQAPSLMQPGSFSVSLEGDRVVAVELAAGYHHRGLEKTCESHTYQQNVFIVERSCASSSHSHTLAYCQAVERLAGIRVSRRAAYIRVVVAELERVNAHLMWLGLAAREIGFDTLFMAAWQDRERVLDILCRLSGSRVNYGLNIPGGVKRDIDAALSQDLGDMLNYIEERNKHYSELVRTDVMLANRLLGVGRLSREQAEQLDVVGPIARACGVERDLRLIEPYAAYDQLKPTLCRGQRGDAYERALLRLAEIDAAIALLRQALSELPPGQLSLSVPSRLPAGEVMCRSEAPCGESVIYLRAKGGDKPDRLRLRSAGDANLAAMEQMLLGSYLADVPLIVTALDPGYSGLERCFIQGGDYDGQCWERSRLRQYGREWQRERGLAFPSLERTARALFSLPATAATPSAPLTPLTPSAAGRT